MHLFFTQAFSVPELFLVSGNADIHVAFLVSLLDAQRHNTLQIVHMSNIFIQVLPW